MHKCARRLIYLAFFVVIPALLSACGGAQKDKTSSLQINPANESEVNSTSTIVDASSSLSLTSPSQDSQSQSSLNQNATQPATIQLQLFQLTETSITLIWDNLAGTSYYEISRNGERIAKIDSLSHIFVDEGLMPYTNYNYTITAFNLTGELAPSQTFTLRTLAVNGAANSMPSPGTQPDSIAPSISAAPSFNPQLSVSLSSTSSTVSSNRSQTSISSKTSSSRGLSSISSIFSSRSSISSKSSSKSSKSSASSVNQQAVTISWNHPSQRENGTFLELNEIGGYKIRYRKPTDTSFIYITLNGNLTTEYIFLGEAQDLEFEIAVFDSRGVHSRFTKINR